MILRRQPRAWLDGWEPVVAANFHHWSRLDGDERRRLGTLLEWFVSRKRFEAARGFQLTQRVVLTIGANAALLVLEVGRDAYRDVASIIVHRGTITHRGVRSTSVRGVVADGPRQLAGHALDRRGPVVISWRAVRSDARLPGSGQNVILHELAHKLDAADGMFDGTPELGGRDEREQWVRVCTAEYRRLRRRPDPSSVLRDYAATNPAEFFAVATEAFFETPLELRASRPRLYEVLARYYGQDPAGRAIRTG